VTARTESAPVGPVAGTASTTVAPPRNGYFDLLRGAALVRVVVYHGLSLAWLHVALPAMGVMFGLGGALFVRSLKRRHPAGVVWRRALRLLVPLWFYALVALLVGWETVGHTPGELARLVFWVLPLRDPRTSATSGLVNTLWYLRAYLWFVILTPLALPLVRRWPAIMIASPLVLLPAAADLQRLHPSDTGWILDVLTYGPCWMIGFLEADGSLALISGYAIAIIAGIAGVIGLGLDMFAGGLAPPLDGLGQMGYAVWSAAVVLVLLRLGRDTGRLTRRRWLNKPVTFVNARAVTIYLWHDVAIVAVAASFTAAGIATSRLERLPLVILLIATIAIAVGWVEDLGALRPPRLLRPAIGSREHRPIVDHATARPRHLHRARREGPWLPLPRPQNLLAARRDGDGRHRSARLPTVQGQDGGSS
jgi:peptidoglycan/LPS O-acetylase OafA/YrhL